MKWQNLTFACIYKMAYIPLVNQLTLKLSIMTKKFEISLPFDYSVNGFMKHGFRVFYVDDKKVNVRELLNKVNAKIALTAFEVSAMRCDLTNDVFTNRHGFDLDQNQIEELRNTARNLLVLE